MHFTLGLFFYPLHLSRFSLSLFTAVAGILILYWNWKLHTDGTVHCFIPIRDIAHTAHFSRTSQCHWLQCSFSFDSCIQIHYLWISIHIFSGDHVDAMKREKNAWKPIYWLHHAINAKRKFTHRKQTNNVWECAAFSIPYLSL